MSFPEPFLPGPDIQMQKVFLFIKTDTGKVHFLSIEEQVKDGKVIHMDVCRHTEKMIGTGYTPCLLIFLWMDSSIYGLGHRKV